MSPSHFVILLYHGVSSRQHRGIENASRKHIPTSDFDQQMRQLAASFDLLSLPELLDRAENHDLPPRPIAVTFDDGFLNNYTDAYPVLQRYRVPATFFLSTGLLDSGGVFWVDKLEYLFNETSVPRVELDTLGLTLDTSHPSAKRAALHAVKGALKSGKAAIDPVIAELVTASRVRPAYDYHDYRPMTWNHVREMRASGLCTFGAHTVHHAVLRHLSPEDKRAEIQGSQRTLQEQLDEPIDLFSYPEGQPEHFDDETIALLREAGMRASPTAIFGSNDGFTSPFHLRRNMVGFTAPFADCLEGIHAHRC